MLPIVSLYLLGAASVLIFKEERPPKWFLYAVAAKLGLDLVQAMRMARKEDIQSQPKEM